MKKSFTLIELIVVIAIIAILAAIIAPNAFKAIEKAKISKAISELRTIKTAAISFYTDTGTIPCTKAGGWGEDPGFVNKITAANCWADEGGCAPECLDVFGWDGPYLDKWSRSPWYKEIPGSPYGYGGAYDWENWPGYSPRVAGAFCGLGGVVTLENYGAVPVNSLQKIDVALDDGNLDTGYTFTEPPVGDPNYLQYFAVCN